MTTLAEERETLLEQRVKGASGRWMDENGEEDSISIGSSSSLDSTSSSSYSSSPLSSNEGDDDDSVESKK